MRGAKAAVVPLVAILLFLCGQKAAPTTSNTPPGIIKGTVTYENGSPAGGATVYANGPIGVAFMGIVPYSKADKDGHFAIAHLWLGKYLLGAEKLDQDYPNTSSTFYFDGKVKTVVLTARRSVARVTVPLGPKAGILTGTVTDAVTGARLYPCVEFRWANRPRNSLTGTGLVNPKYRVLIPSDTPILMKVWYRGHKPWYYPGTTEKTEKRPVTLRPGEELRVNIRLEPDHNAPPAGCGMPVGTVIHP